QRERGWSWASILDREPMPRLLELLRRSGRRLSGATARLGRTLAIGLGEEGESRRQVGRRVTRTSRPAGRRGGRAPRRGGVPAAGGRDGWAPPQRREERAALFWSE